MNQINQLFLKKYKLKHNHHLYKSIDDIDDANQLEMGDGLSDFDNFRGRDTPIISGRDTTSSHSHEDLHNNSTSRNVDLINNLNISK